MPRAASEQQPADDRIADLLVGGDISIGKAAVSGSSAGAGISREREEVEQYVESRGQEEGQARPGPSSAPLNNTVQLLPDLFGGDAMADIGEQHFFDSDLTPQPKKYMIIGARSRASSYDMSYAEEDGGNESSSWGLRARGLTIDEDGTLRSLLNAVE